jgi:hypothetical protein
MDLVERVMEVLEGEDIDEIVPALTFILARVGKETCNDHRVFLSYLEGVVNQVYGVKREKLND